MVVEILEHRDWAAFWSNAIFKIRAYRFGNNGKRGHWRCSAIVMPNPSTAKENLAMNPVDPMAVAQKAMAQIKKGAFLTVQTPTALNTMTIGWAAIGYCWHKPIFMVAVRNSRHTYGLLENNNDLTVSVPSIPMKEQLRFCGTQSGRDVDKFAVLKLQTVPAQHVRSPIIGVVGIHFECAVIVKTPLDPALMVGELESLYPEKDYHKLYFGEILACYQTNQP
jgi:flavin reductase (DIM6/NTAB) family NADH-FMN oxidoreductase RutF